MHPNLARLARTATTRPILNESALLALICLLDTFSTLLWVRTGVARETNPLLIGALDHSDAAFLLIKGASFVVPIVVLETIRPLRPQMVVKALRWAVGGYLGLYLVGSLFVRFCVR